MSNTVPERFLGLDERHANYRQARFAVLPIPYDATVSYQVGTREGPRAIINASRQVELYDMELGHECFASGVATLDPLEPDARGPREMHERIYHTARKVVRDGKFLVGLGGEHGVTSALVRAVVGKYKKTSVLQIDAHADLRDTYHDSPYSHASVMRRVHELGVPAVGVGIRNYSAEEARFIRKTGKPIIPAHICRTRTDWIDEVLLNLTDQVYLSIDIDGFDPAYAPGTGTPEPGGLDWYQVTALMAAVAAKKSIVALDLTEVRPIPGTTATEFLAAKLIYRIMGLMTGK